MLLTLLCLVFGEEGDFPTNRSELYGEGVKVLLKKWDAKRNIQRDDHYKKLDVQRREDLLSYVALQTFRENEYFVKQRRMEGYIADFISNLRDVNPEPESLRMDSEIVLKSIQGQHGLLVERARGIYSFSHLTFHEYFTAKEIVLTNDIQNLVPQVNQPRWQEVFFLTSGMLRNADKLLLMMKRHIDLSIKDDPKLQQFLQYIDHKTQTVDVNYKSVAIRASYLDLNLAIDLILAIDLDKTLFLALFLARALVRALDFERVGDCQIDSRYQGSQSTAYLDSERVIDYQIDRAIHLNRTLDHVLSQGCTFEYQLRDVSDRLLTATPSNRKIFKQWWSGYGRQWTEDLRQIMIAHRNIGHDWQFTNEQKQLLQQYHDANLLLVQCLNSDCYVSRHVRQSIEDTLLLPYEKLKIENVE